MYGQDILCGISKGTFEIPHKISYPYIERHDFQTKLKFQEFLELISVFEKKTPSPISLAWLYLTKSSQHLDGWCK